MPYISTDQVKKIRDYLKKELPDYKLSVTREHATGVNVAIMEGPIDFGTPHGSVNHFYIERDWEGEARRVLQVIADATESNNRTLYHDSDYGNVPQFYVCIEIGKWDKPYKLLQPVN